MRPTITRKRLAFALSVAGAFATVTASLAAATATVVGGLDGPRGIALGSDGRLLVAETPSGDLTEIHSKGKGLVSTSTVATLPTAPGGEWGPVDVASLGRGETYALVGGGSGAASPASTVVRVLPNGTTSQVADIGAYQQGDPDPNDLEDFAADSNPNGIAVLTGSDFLVADAGGNDLLLVRKDGSIETVARFPTLQVPWPDGFPFGPPPGTLVAIESVPTAVAIGPDRAWYVSELTGFPETVGAARIWRVEPGTREHDCDASATSEPCDVLATGFTNVIDIAFGPDGTLYVLEIAKDGLNDFFFTGTEPIGALWALKDGVKTLVDGNLPSPGGVAVVGEIAYVTTGTLDFSPGSGNVVAVDL